MKTSIPEELSLPGMLEKSERLLLFQTASKLPAHHIVLEFGTFLGASTACLAHGLKKQSRDKRLFSFDLFQCPLNTVYSKMVMSVGQQLRVHPHVKTSHEGEVIHYRRIVDSLLNRFDNIELVECNIYSSSELIKKSISGRKIGLLHLDAPKDWKLLKCILSNTVSHLGENSLIFEQDFFFECSSSLVIAIYYLEKNGYLSIKKVAASTVVFKWNKKLGEISSLFVDDVDDFFSDLNSTQSLLITTLVECAKFYSSAVELDSNQRQSLACALVNFLLMSPYEEDFKIQNSIQIMHILKIKPDNTLFSKVFRILSRAHS